MARDQTAVGGPLMGGPDTTQVQTSLMPPAAVSLALRLRYDATTRQGSVGYTVKDAATDTEVALVAMPFRHGVSVAELLAEAVERLQRTLELVLDPDPF